MKTQASQKTQIKTPPPIKSLLKVLDQEFPDVQPPLKHRSSFELLVAVILSAQCTDARVNMVTADLFPKDHPCVPEDLLNLSSVELERKIHSCTYSNSKTKALLTCAKQIKEQGGRVPSDLKSLTNLAGVGPKTAQVVQSQWFNMPAFPVDTHVHRVCNRLGLAHAGKNRAKTEREVKTLVPKEAWSKLHLQLIYHGRKTCTAFKPKCSNCPLFALCEWPDKSKH